MNVKYSSSCRNLVVPPVLRNFCLPKCLAYRRFYHSLQSQQPGAATVMRMLVFLCLSTRCSTRQTIIGSHCVFDRTFVALTETEFFQAAKHETKEWTEVSYKHQRTRFFCGYENTHWLLRYSPLLANAMMEFFLTVSAQLTYELSWCYVMSNVSVLVVTFS